MPRKPPKIITMSIAHQPAISLEAFETLGHGVCLVDGADRITLWNGRLETLGIPASRTSGAALRQVLAPILPHPPRGEEILQTLHSARDGHQTLLLRDVMLDFPTHAGQIFHLCFTPLTGNNGAVAIIFENVTEPLRVREQFERILDSTPDGIFIIDAERRIRVFNKACARITGHAARDILHEGCECSDVIQCHTEGGVSYAHSLCPAKQVFRGEIMHQREEMLLTNDAGEERWVETTYSPVLAPDGKVSYVIGILRDVHDRKMLEEKLNQSEKLASLGQLVAGIAHEIKNPLAIILSSMDVIENRSRPEEQRREAARFIREEIRRLDDRLRAFLAFARPRNAQPRPLLLSGLLTRRAASFNALFPNIHFAFDISQPEPIVMGDEDDLGQLLTNLILNAGEALQGAAGTITLRARQQADHAVLEVEDDGPGIPKHHHARVFDPFFTTKTEGTGLGLSICYQIALAHKGTISIAAGRNGRGACFAVRLPIAATVKNESTQ